MSFSIFGPRQAGVLWMDPQALRVKGQIRAHEGSPTEDQVAQALQLLPAGPTSWVLDDPVAPALILRDVMDAPTSGEAREQFFRWRYTQAMGPEGLQAVQALPLEESVWLLVGVSQDLRDRWSALAARLGRPIFQMVPRWLWLYNRLAPARELPGMLLSLAPAPGGGHTGTLAAWGRQLSLVRQWSEPADLDTWAVERVSPTVAFLQREGRTPQECHVWGAPDFRCAEVPVKPLLLDIPLQEAL